MDSDDEVVPLSFINRFRRGQPYIEDSEVKGAVLPSVTRVPHARPHHRRRSEESDDGLVVLSAKNPFDSEAHRQRLDDESDVEAGITIFPSDNPFAAASSHRRRYDVDSEDENEA